MGCFKLDEEKTFPTADTNDKKKMKKGTKILLIIVGILVGIAIVMAAAVLILTAVGRDSMTDESGMDLSAYAGEFESLDSGIIRYKGKLYQYNDEISCVLLLGIDTYQKQEFSGAVNNNQNDVNVLAILDPKNQKMTLLSISRDTLCTIDVLNDDGTEAGTAQAQLALAYSYGDGAEQSCELTAKAVSRLFYGLKVPAFASIYMNGISDLVDLVGGVNVTPSESFNGFNAGQQYELKGDLTEKYIRFRESTVEGNNQRMEHQNQVILSLVYKGLHNAKSNPSSVLDLYSGVKDNTSTNVNTAMMVYLAQQAVKLDFDGQIHKVPGHSELGEQNHAVFIVDEDAFFEQVLGIFYNEIK